MAMVFYILFEKYGKIFARDVSPQWIKQRLPLYYETKAIISSENIIIVCTACALGSTTHLVWDAFTHQWGWGVDLFPTLKGSMTIFEFTLPYYKIIQYGSTIVGLPMLFLLCLIPIIRSKLQNHTATVYYSTKTIFKIVVSVILIPFMIAIYHWNSGVENVDVLLGYTIKHTIAISIMLFFTFSLIHWWINYQTPKV